MHPLKHSQSRFPTWTGIRPERTPIDGCSRPAGGGAHGFGCMMEGFDAARVSKLLNLQDGAFPIMVIGADDGVFWPQVRFDRSLFVHEV